MTDDSLLARAGSHLETAKRMVAEHRDAGLLGRVRRGLGRAHTGLDEVAAATTLAVDSIAGHADAVARLTERVELLEAATGGDEILLDDVAMALDELQRQVATLSSRIDRLVERVDG